MQVKTDFIKFLYIQCVQKVVKRVQENPTDKVLTTKKLFKLYINTYISSNPATVECVKYQS